MTIKLDNPTITATPIKDSKYPTTGVMQFLIELEKELQRINLLDLPNKKRKAYCVNACERAFQDTEYMSLTKGRKRILRYNILGLCDITTPYKDFRKYRVLMERGYTTASVHRRLRELFIKLSVGGVEGV